MRRILGAGGIAVLLVAGMATSAQAAEPIDSSALRAAVGSAGIGEHLDALQAIADANGGTRASGTPGFDASAEYVKGKLAAAGYTVSEQAFDFDLFTETAPAEFEQLTPTATVYGADDFATMEYSGGGEVTGEVVDVDLTLPPTAQPSSTSGCEASDFVGVAGRIALVQRGTCTFADKAVNAEAAGAIGLIIFNEGQDGRTEVLGGTLGDARPTIPVIGTSFAVGAELAAATGATARIEVTRTIVTKTTRNVFGDSPTGRTDRTVVVGAHLDSVIDGPGMNDNGSGSATTLEIAEQLSGTTLRNATRFAFWGAEESGLVGSQRYVDGLSARDRKNIAVNLNFDMLGSPNPVNFVYDGDGSATETAGPNGSGNVEKVFLDYFAAQNVPNEPTAFDGRSDYGPFIDAGIPAGGLFSGAEEIKTAEQAAVYGGTAGIAYDPCYHATCDNRANISNVALDALGDAAAHATLTFAQTTSAVNGAGKASSVDSSTLAYRAGELQK